MPTPANPCKLRPLAQSDLPVFELAYSSRRGAGDHQWFGHGSPGRSLAEMGVINADGGRLAVTVDDRVIGSACWFRRIWGPADTSWCWEIALHIHAGERGKGFGAQSVELLVRYLFEHTLAWRIQAITDVANEASQRMLARVGFTREGVLRSAQWREGRWHDQHIYSLLRGD